MPNTKRTLLSLGAAIATTKLAHMVSGMELDDVLRPVGLARRRRQWPGKLAFLGAGIVVGGVTALLLAPSAGEQARARVAKKAGELGDAHQGDDPDHGLHLESVAHVLARLDEIHGDRQVAINRRRNEQRRHT